MRKLYSLIIAAALTATVSSSAAVANHNELGAIVPAPKGIVFNQQNNLQQNSRQQSLIGNQSIAAKTPLAQSSKRLKVSAKAAKLLAEEASSPEYITEAPAGETKLFSRSSLGYYSYYGYIMYEQDYGSVGEVVFANNNEVYIKNPFSSLPTGTYLKGSIDGDIITVSFPQPIYQESYYGYTYDYYAAALIYDDDTFVFNEDSQDIKFQYADGKITSYGDNLEEELIGLVYYDPEGETIDDQYYWMGYGDNQYEFLPFEDEAVTVPAEATVKQKAIAYSDGYAQLGNVAKNGNEVYIQGIVPGYDEAWVKGTLSDGKVTFASEQFLGINETYNHYIYFYGGTAVENYYEYLDYYYTSYERGDEYVLNYDEATDSYSAASEDAVVIGNLGKGVDYVETAAAISSIHEQGDISNSKPAAPIITDYSDFDDWYGYITFTFPNVDLEGNVLPTDKLYYNFLVDGEPYTLYPDEYYDQELDELTDIPYSYTDSYDVLFDGATHYIYFYCEGADSIGIQIIYRPEEGKDVLSEAAIINLNESGVNSIVNNKQISNESYYDLTGRTVVNPEHGLFIKKVNYSDGTSKAEKVIK